MVHGDRIQLKNFNRRAVLNTIRKKGAATKAGLSSMTGLTFMAIKKILEELETLDLVRSGETEGNGVGRKAQSYVINEMYRYTIGIHINKFITRVAVLNLKGQIIKSQEYMMDRGFEGQNEFVKMLVDAIEQVVCEAGIKKEDILGIGVGAPGPLDCEKGIILTPPNIPLIHYLPIKEVLEKYTGLSVFLNKDTNAIAFGEYWYGGPEDDGMLFYVDVDMGIGNGLIVNGRINVGANSTAGEIGHMVIDPEGPRCNCGNRGCLEAMGSGIAILRDVSEQLDKNPQHALYEKRNALTIDDIFEMADKRDILVISILNKAAFYVGAAVANMINILDPAKIILGGIVVQKYPDFYPIVLDVANAGKVKSAKKNVISCSGLRENAGVIGAAEMVTEYFFNEKVNEVFEKTD